MKNKKIRQLVYGISALSIVTAAAPPPSRAGTVRSRAVPLYSWTNKEVVLTNLPGWVTKQTKWAQDCIAKIAANSEQTSRIEKCEGNGLAAGPGIYTSDNPFTSRDYGEILLEFEAIADSTRVGDGTGLGPADEMSRDLTGDPNLDAIVYDFRSNSLNANALVIRSPMILNLEKSRAFKIKPKEYKTFRTHSAFECSENSSLSDIMTNWGDQLEFLSFVYDAAPGFDSSTSNAVAAAVAADTTALPQKEFEKRLALINKKFPEVEGSMGTFSCTETATGSTKSCFFRRVYDSIKGDEGSERYPTYSWNFETTKKVLREINFLVESDMKIVKDHQTLIDLLSARYMNDAQRFGRMNEAARCALGLHKKISAGHLGLWIEN